jgi:IS30 family transposase
MYNPELAEARRLEVRRSRRLRLKMSGEVWSMVKPQLEKRWSPEEAAKWLKKEYPCYAMPGKTIDLFDNPENDRIRHDRLKKKKDATEEAFKRLFGVNSRERR